MVKRKWFNKYPGGYLKCMINFLIPGKLFFVYRKHLLDSFFMVNVDFNQTIKDSNEFVMVNTGSNYIPLCSPFI